MMIAVTRLKMENKNVWRVDPGMGSLLWTVQVSSYWLYTHAKPVLKFYDYQAVGIEYKDHLGHQEFIEK